MEKGEILIINDLLTGGGVENVMQNLVEYLINKEYKITILTEYFDENFKEIYPDNVRYWHFLRKKNERLGFLARVADRILYRIVPQYVLPRLKFDVVIAIKEGLMTQWGALCNAKYKFSWVHVDYNYLYWTKWIFKSSEAERECMKQFNKVVCVSESTKVSVIDTIGDPGNLCVRYNPLNVRKLREKANGISEYNRDLDKMLFVAVGRLTEQKHFDMLLKCVYNIGMKECYELWIIGEGNDRLMLEEIIRKYDLYNVKLLGNQNNPYSLMIQADWIVSSAVWESFGLVLQEARILGIPVLTTSCPAVEEVFDNNSGIMVENTEQALTEKMFEIVKNNDRGMRYIENFKNLDISELYERRLEDIERLWLN